MSVKRKRVCECVTQEFADTKSSTNEDGNHLKGMRLKFDSSLEIRELTACDVFCLRKAWGRDKSTTSETMQHILRRSITILSQGEREPQEKDPASS